MYQNAQLFFSTIVAVFLEASPFLLLGALLSSVFEIYMPQDLLERHLPKNYFLGVFFGLFAGMLVPTCECGVVFIARRLLKKNVPSHIAMTYLFSAPVINPLVLAATYVAFRGNLRMVLARVFVVAACACVMGAVAGKYKPDFLLRKGSDSDDHGHLDHEPAAAQLSFMALGPMVDLKLIFMYGSVFRKRFVLLMIVLPIICVYLLSLLTASGVKI